jgi:glycyl-tRNA synthetase beta chain
VRTTPDLLLEVGCEELPAVACREAESQLPQLAAKALADVGLESAEIHAHVAPRRLVVRALGVPAERPAVRREQRGP